MAPVSANELARRMAREILRQSLSVDEIASRTGVSDENIGRLLSEDWHEITLRDITDLVQGLNIDFEALLTEGPSKD